MSGITPPPSSTMPAGIGQGSLDALIAVLVNLVIATNRLSTPVIADQEFLGNNSGASSAPFGLTAAQAAAILNVVGGVLKTKVVSTTYGLATATGTQAVTGVGFTPTSVALLTSKPTTSQWSVGFSDSAKGSKVITMFFDAATTTANTASVAYYSDAAGANSQIATMSTYDTDGFTLSWTKTGAPVGTLQILALCMR